MRLLAIGDIHGCSGVLDELLHAVDLSSTDRLIFLGDYVDRGPDTKGVLDRVIRLREKFDVVNLRGNHELMMSRARLDKANYRMWTSVGGMQALGSYGASPGRMGTLADVPEAHWNFLDESCQNYYETDDHIFVHAGVSPTLPMNQQDEGWLFWEFLQPKFVVPHVSGKTIICGHTSQRSGEILDCGTTICLDTYAYGGGWLSCLDVRSRRYWQANILGQVRSGHLN